MENELKKAIEREKKLLSLVAVLPQKEIKERGLRGKLFMTQADILYLKGA